MEVGSQFLFEVYKSSRDRVQRLKTVTVAMMILFSMALIGFLHLLWGTSLATRFGYDQIIMESGGFSNVIEPVTRSSIHQKAAKLSELINSKENKQVFVHLQNSDYAFYDPDQDIVGTGKYCLDNHYLNQPYVSNGYIGSRIPNLGQGFSYDQVSGNNDDDVAQTVNGWPLFNARYSGAFIAGFFDTQRNTSGYNFPELLEKGYESVISSVPQWTTLQLSCTINGTDYVLDPSINDASKQGVISDYVQTMSLQNGIVVTEFTWLDTFRVSYEVLAHRSELTLGIVKLQIHNLNVSAATVKVSDVLDIQTAQRSQLNDVGHDGRGIFINFHPDNIDYVYGCIYSTLETDGSVVSKHTTDSSVYQQTELNINGQSYSTVDKYAGVVSSDLSPDSLTSKDLVQKIAKSTATKYLNNRSLYLFKSHDDEWKKILSSRVTFKDSSLLTLANRASLFHLAANTRPNAQGITGALGVSGLSSDSYGGMVFWDTDLWMLNGLLPYLPEHSKSFVNYRLYTHDQAIKNIPTGYDGAVYPWTSGRFGNCTATGPCMDYEYHINMAVSFAAWQIYISGNGDDNYLRDTASLLIDDAAKFMARYVKYNSTYGEFTTHNMTDPDEYANHVDNGAYTNAAISLLMKYSIAIGKHLDKLIPSEFTRIVENIHLPVSDNADNITLEYTGMKPSIEVKQADVIMITYPLENEMITEEQAFVNMQFYAMKQVSYGPAMTYPIFSVVSGALAQSGCSSQSYLEKSVKPFIRAPFAQFLEQNNDNPLSNGGTHPAFPFLTAHGGLLQASLQGVTGFRFDYEINKEGKIERMLKLDPIELALFEKGVYFEGIKYMNSSLAMNINSSHLTVFHEGISPGSESFINDITIKIADRNPKAGKYKLKKHESLTIPLLKIKPTNSGSVSECKSADFLNITESNYGGVSLMMNDGDNFTHWQSKHRNNPAKVLIDLKQYKNITGGVVNWGDKPPKFWALSKFDLDKDFTAYEILATVDFGNDLIEGYKAFRPKGEEIIDEAKAFTKLISQDVNITAPYDPAKVIQSSVSLPDAFNTTEFTYSDGINTKFLLLEFNGVHDPAPSDKKFAGGGKLFEALFY